MYIYPETLHYVFDLSVDYNCYCDVRTIMSLLSYCLLLRHVTIAPGPGFQVELETTFAAQAQII